MPDKLRGLMDRNILTAIAVFAAVACLIIAFGAAATGHYDSASVRAFIDDLKWIAGAGLFGTAIGRGLLAAGQRIGDGQTEAVLARAQLTETPAAAPPAEAAAPDTPPLQPSQTGLTGAS